MQSASIRRAEERVRAELAGRQARLSEEMRAREVRCLAARQAQQEETRRRLEQSRARRAEKDKKVELLQCCAS